MKKLQLVMSFLLWGSILSLSAQNSIQEEFQISIRKATGPIVLDGNIEEEAWKNAGTAEDFWQKWPRNDTLATFQTTAWLTYDDQFLYIAARLEDSEGNIIQTLKRDADYWDSDGFSVVLDPLNEKTYGFIFGCSVLGVQMEGLIIGFEGVGEEWDNRWFAEVQRQTNSWTVEMAIPFKTLRYKDGKSEWGINFIRNDIKRNEYHTWTQIPLQFEGIDLGYTGKLVWEEAPKKVNGNIAVIPYIAGGVDVDYEEDGEFNSNFNAGLDAKVAVSSSLNLDLTVNPDFSQIEVDQQVTNLTRFSIFFPERRTFFLENSDLFAGFGIPPIRPFFSRRIGLDDDANRVPILFGARLSGNANKDWRVGVMSMQTGKTDDLLGQNYTVAAFQRRLFERSNIKGMFQSRQAFEDGSPVGNDYGRNADVEFTYQNASGKWTAWSGYHRSFKPGITKDASFYNAGFWYNGKNLSIVTDALNMDTDYFADMGFIARIENYDAERDTSIRLGFRQVFNELAYSIFPEKSERINQHVLRLETFLVWNPDGTFNEQFQNLGYSVRFKNRSFVGAYLSYNRVNLLYPFSFTDDEFEPLPVDLYDNYSYSMEYESDERKLFSWSAEFTYWPRFYSGNLTSYNLELAYRVQPWGNFNLNFEYNDLQFSEEYGSASLFLISPRIEVNFSRSIFWTTFLQFNTQADNFNINSRLQWRFSPMSDLFVVYTDNYNVEAGRENGMGAFFHSFFPKNRALVFKLNYWLNL